MEVTKTSYYVNREYNTNGGSASGFFSNVANTTSANVDLSGYPLKIDVDASLLIIDNKNISRDASIVDLRNKNTSQDASIVRIDSSILNILTGTTTFGGTKTFSNQIISDNGMKSSNFIPGILGQGYACGSTAQFERLIINEDLDVRTIRNNIITAENGTRILNSSVTAIDTSSEGAGFNKDASGYYFNVEPWLNSMRVGYPIVAQSESASGIENLSYTVTDVSGGKIYVNLYDTSTLTTPPATITNVNLSTFSLVAPPGFYSIGSNASNQYCKTADFNVSSDSSLYINSGSDTTVSYGTMQIALYTKDGSLHQVLWTFNAGQGSNQNTSVNIIEDVSLHIRYILTGSGYSADLYPSTIQAIKYIEADAPNVKGRTFVRNNGNPIIETAVLPWAPGTRWLKDTSNALSHNQNDILAAIGNLYDISINGKSLSEGAYLPNAAITGYAEINEGKIANVLIKDGGLSSSTDGQRWELDVNNGGLFCYDEAGNGKVSVHVGNIQNLDDLVSITNKSYTGSYATTYTTKSMVATIMGVCSSTFHIGEYSSNASYIQNWDAVPSSSYQFDVYTANRYWIQMSEQVDYSYTTPSNYTEYPSPGIEVTHTFTTEGSYDITFDTSVYNSSNVALGGHLITISNRVSQGLTTSSLTNYVTFDTAKVYIKKKVSINNKFRHKEYVVVYAGGNPVSSITNYIDASVAFTLKTTKLLFQGSAEFTEMGDNGMNVYFAADKYFSVQKTRGTIPDYVIKTAGTQLHTAPNFDIVTSGAVRITGDITVSGKIKPKGVEYDDTYSTSTSYTLDNEEACYIFNGSSNGTVYLPSSPLSGQQHIIINRTTSYTVTINGNGKNLYDSGSSYTTRPCGQRQSWTLIYNGAAWSTVAYR